MALNGFAPAAVTRMAASSVSSVVTISGTTVLVTNLGSVPAFVVLGAAATVATGVAVLPGTSLALTVAGTQLAAITETGTAVLNVASGA